ncbi:MULTISPECIES: hypothetical protein [Aliiglaciecola]|uniref:hypothetical protein n=1 Tax=Aliiglaciecola TaxID=1406885 RepID=UPI001C09A2D1|nr:MULTISPECIES: hypothetical protein [Aliiglaciecola]MBU2876884.1 hypothetical protein [Aliiglaciecola lipolytica]MDO6713196.1 hypothetical protein [Aliiglaciecola sp. 2_MG-2023]MDO6754318.1 hypothetical protein [Aliiglaciecola sp. 1_MG-2023]
MKKLIKFSLVAIILLTAITVRASDRMSQTELKLSALQLCRQAAVDTYGVDAIVSVRKRVEWQRDTSRRLWFDGLRASVRMVLRLDEVHLARVMCLVDQQQRMLLTVVKVSPDGESGLLATSKIKSKYLKN